MNARNWPPKADAIITDAETGLPVLREEWRRWDVTIVRTFGAVEHVRDVWAFSREGAQAHAVAFYRDRGAPVLYTSAVPARPMPVADEHSALEAMGREADRRTLVDIAWLAAVSLWIVALLVICVTGPEWVGAVWESLQ